MNNKNITISAILITFAYVVITQQNFTVILSGVAIFIIGMFFMQDGFKQLSGGILEKLLQKFTNTSYYAVTTGLVATSIVQSSTITTLLTISFVGAELITLTQGIGVVFGSNIGSTTTAWIVSLIGVDMKISTYAFPMIVFGVIFRFFKTNTMRGAGNVLLGLGFIFLGIAYMKDGFDVLKDQIDLAKYTISGYGGVLLYILIGLLVTVIVQSSGATLALAITALNAGSIILINAMAISIGASIGTVLTAILASLTSTQDAKRVATSHLLFNIITSIIMAIFIYKFESFIDFISPSFEIIHANNGMKLALFHTLQSVIGVVLLTPFIPSIVKLLEKIIPQKVSLASKPKYLSNIVSTNPDASVVAIRKEIINLYEHCQKAIFHALSVHTTGLNKQNLKDQLDRDLNIIDTNLDEIYHSDLKELYSEIIKYTTFAQENMFDFQHKEVGELKRSAVLIVDALKDTRDIQKNINYYLKSKNEYIKKEYNLLREELCNTLIDINHISTLSSDTDKLTCLEVLKTNLLNKDKEDSREIDTLIREDKIKATMATSYINDNATNHSIQRKLIEASSILFLNNNLLRTISRSEDETK